MTAIFGLVWLWFGLIGLAGFLLGVWGVFQLAADDRYLTGLQDGTANIKHRDKWLRQHFGEKGRKLWLANEARRHGCGFGSLARRVPGSPDVYSGTVNDAERDITKYSYSPPWGRDDDSDGYVTNHAWIPRKSWLETYPKEVEYIATHTEPRPCDWLASGFGFGGPFQYDGRWFDPLQDIKSQLVTRWQSPSGQMRWPIDDGGAMDKWAKQTALDIEAAGGVRARGISVRMGYTEGYDHLGRNNR